MKPLTLTALPVSEFVTKTSLAPAPLAGVKQVMLEDETTETLVQEMPPTVTVALEEKLVPVMVIEVPPDTKPLVGETPLTVGSLINIARIGRT